jgi:hypothetical protein
MDIRLRFIIGQEVFIIFGSINHLFLACSREPVTQPGPSCNHRDLLQAILPQKQAVETGWLVACLAS